jgi:glycine/D-amino acid oxidase-like deaminating enzyme
MSFDCAVIGAGVMGCSTALHLARGGMRVALLDRGEICREASGVNAGTLTMQMTRAALIPYALRAHGMWLRMAEWCDGGHVDAVACPGLSVAFTAAEAAMLEERAHHRRLAGAPIELVSGSRAQAIEPGLADRVLLAGHCPIDGFASAYLTGRAFRGALLNAGVALWEGRAVRGIAPARPASCWTRPRARCGRAASCWPAASGWRGWPSGSACACRSRCWSTSSS